MSIIINKPRSLFTEKTKEKLVLSICLICIFLLLSTAYSKIIGYHGFSDGLSIVPVIGNYAKYIALLVPTAEITIAALLIIPKTYKWGLYGFTILMTLFTGYIVSMLLWAEKMPCHCGGAIEKLSWTQHVWFNLGFITLATFALWLSKNKYYQFKI